MKKKIKYNTNIQKYKGIQIQLIKYTDRHFAALRAKRFLLIPDSEEVMTNQNVWIPNRYLEEDGTLKQNADIDFVFIRAMFQRKLKYAGIHVPYWLWMKAQERFRHKKEHEND